MRFGIVGIPGKERAFSIQTNKKAPLPDGLKRGIF
jgi:hypothetical protein